MADDNKSNEGSKKGDEGQPKIDDVMKRLEELENSNKRLLDESKSWKDKAKAAEKEREDAEKKKAQESGDLAKQLELERKEREKLANDNKSLKGKTLKQNIRTTVSRFAKDVHDLEDFLNQPKFAKILEDGINTEDLTVSEEAAKNYVNKVLEEKPWMKKIVEQEHVDNTKPKTTTTPKTDYSKMSSKEIEADILKTAKA